MKTQLSIIAVTLAATLVAVPALAIDSLVYGSFGGGIGGNGSLVGSLVADAQSSWRNAQVQSGIAASFQGQSVGRSSTASAGADGYSQAFLGRGTAVVSTFGRSSSAATAIRGSAAADATISTTGFARR